jgi:hypothetical protein
MENRGNFFKGKEKKYFILAVLPAIFIFLFIIFYEIINDKNERKKTLLNLERFAVANLVYISNNHNFIYVKYSNGEDIIKEYGILEGDSISKKSGDSTLYIFRKDSVIKINLFEYYNLN